MSAASNMLYPSHRLSRNMCYTELKCLVGDQDKGLVQEREALDSCLIFLLRSIHSRLVQVCSNLQFDGTGG